MSNGAVTIDPSAESPSAASPAETEGRKPQVGVTIARNSFWLLIDSSVGFASAFYCSIAVARGLGPDRMGDYNYIMWFANVLRLVTELAIPATLRKFAAELMGQGEYVKLKTLVSRVLRIQVGLGTLGVGVGLGLVFLFSGRGRWLFACVAVLSVLPALIRSIPAGAIQATENLRPNVVSSLSAITVNVVGITLSIVLHWGLLGVIISFLACRTVECVLSLIFFRLMYARLPGEVSAEPIDPELRRRLIRFARNQAVLIVSQIVLWDRMEVFFIKLLSVSREISFFSLGITLTQYTLMLPAVMAGSAGATIMVQQGRAPGEVARLAGTAVWFTMLVAAPCLFGMAAVSGPLMKILYGSKYVAAIPALSALSIFALSQALQYPIGPFLLAKEEQGFIIKWSTVMMAVDFALCLLLIPRHGALGAACAKGAAHFVGVTGFLVFMNRRLQVPIPVWRMVKMLIICSVMALSVYSMQRVLPPLGALAAGIPLGVAVFALLTRWSGCLDDADRDRLNRVDRLLPARVRPPFRALVRFLVPAA